MANEFELSFTGAEINERLEKAGNAILLTEQELTEEQKAMVRLNIGASALEDNKNYETKEAEYIYDGDNEAEGRVWAFASSGSKAFVKVADLPEGEIHLSGGFVNVVRPDNTWNDYSFSITDEMLNESVQKGNTLIHASSEGFVQIFYKYATDNTPITVLAICKRPGFYNTAFDGETWVENIRFPEKGVYFFDNRKYGGNKHCKSLSCTVSTIASDEEESPIEYQGDEIQMFSRGICIGDSITEGVFNHIAGEKAVKKYSYPSILKRMTGVDIVNAGVAGSTSKTWYNISLDSSTESCRWVNNEWVWSAAPEVNDGDEVSTQLNYEGFDFAIIHLGINDVGMMGEATLEEALATFNTNINNIISKLKTSNRGIKIFLATIIPCYAFPGHTAFEAFNTKIREIASATEDVFLIDLNQYSALYDGTAYENSHLTALGYHKMASEIISLINYTISKNLDSFKAVQFIGTDYTIE